VARWEAERHDVVDKGEMTVASDRKMRMTTPRNGTGSSYRIQGMIRAFKLSNTSYPLSPQLPAGYSSFEKSATMRAQLEKVWG